MNLNETASSLESSSMKNISELESIPVSLDVKEESKENSKGESYNVRFVEVDEIKYRVPFTVLKDLKAILEKKPDLEKFCVSRVGSTKEDTRYQVIPL